MKSLATIVLEKLSLKFGEVAWKPRLDPLPELVYTILSQNTSDKNSERAFKNLTSVFKNMELLVEADRKVIEKCIKVGGLAAIKSARIQKVLQTIIRLRGNLDLSFLADIPLENAKNWLKDLPGIGPKSAAVILCFSFGRPAMPVDTHIYRVASRLGLIPNKASFQSAHDILENLVLRNEIFRFHVYLIQHGRTICKAQKPLCSSCILQNDCPSSNNY
jgi:endonuclease-3